MTNRDKSVEPAKPAKQEALEPQEEGEKQQRIVLIGARVIEPGDSIENYGPPTPDELAPLEVRDNGFVFSEQDARKGESLKDLLEESDTKDLLIYGLREVVSYLQGPMFLDSFDKHRSDAPDEYSRNDLEQQQFQSSPETYKWLTSNRVGFNKIGLLGSGLGTIQFGLDGVDKQTLTSEQQEQLDQVQADIKFVTEAVEKYKNQVRYVTVNIDDFAREKNYPIDELRKNFKPDADGNITYSENDPTRGYDTLSIGQKAQLVEEITNAAGRVLEAFGFQAEYNSMPAFT